MYAVNTEETGMGMTKQMKIAAAGAAAAAVIGGGIFAYTQLSGADPKETVIQAFENIYAEGQTAPAEELFGLKEFAREGISSSREAGLTLKMDSCSEPTVNLYAGSGLRVGGKNDMENSKSSGNMGIIYNGMDLVNLNFYYGDDIFMASVPELSSKVFTLDLGEGLEERVKNSPFIGPVLEQSGINAAALTEYIDLVTAQTEKAEKEGRIPFDLEQLMNRYREGCKAQENFKAALLVEKGEKASFTIDGKEEICKGYEVSVSKDSMIHFLRTSSEFFLQDEVLKEDFLNQLKLSVKLSQLMGAGMGDQDFSAVQELQQQTYEETKNGIEEMITFLEHSLNDVNMTVHVDKKGRLASVKGTTAINSPEEGLEPAAVEFNWELKGGSYLTQNMKLQAAVENADGHIQILAVKEGSYDGKKLTAGLDVSVDNQGEIAETWDITFDGTYDSESGAFDISTSAAQDKLELLGISARGAVDELEKGKSIHLTLDSMDISAMGDTGNAVLSGEYYFKPLTDQPLPLEGDAMDVLAAGEDEWNSVMIEMLFGAIGLSGQLDTGN